MDQSYLLRTKRVVAYPTQVNTPDIFAEEYDDVWPSRQPSSVRRYRSDASAESSRIQADVYTRRASSQPGYKRLSVDTEDVVAVPRAHTHWLVYVGLAMFIMVLGWSLLTALANWWQVTQDDWRYGRPRTYQTDYVVGHNDSVNNKSHFIAVNVNRRIQVVEFPGGDASKAKMYLGPELIGQGQDLAAVTLSFKDVNGDKKVDMLIHVQDSHFVFVNEQGQFRPLRQGEHVQL